MVYRITVQSQLDLSSERQPGKWDMAARAQVGVPGSPPLPGEELCNPLLPSNFSLKDNGVGGLGDDFEVKFRQLFISRTVPPQTISALGLPHIRGVLLHGPPG